MNNTIIATSGAIIYRMAKHFKIDPEVLFTEAGVDTALLRDPNARINAKTLDSIWMVVGKKVKSPCFGLQAAEFWHPSDLHALGYAWLSSATLRSALERLCRYTRVVTDVDDFRLEDSENETSLIVNNNDLPDDVLWSSDSALSILLSMCRANYGEKLDPVSVHFVHPEPQCASDYYEFFRCPVHFGSLDNRIVFLADQIDEQLDSANAMIAQVNDRIIIDYLADLDKNDVIQRVRSAIIEQLPSGNITDAVIASKLNRNERTLQRQLQKEGTTFKTLHNEIRSELASKYIRNSQLSLTEISFMLGFSEISSFSRAFKRWFGVSPTKHRQAPLSG